MCVCLRVWLQQEEEQVSGDSEDSMTGSLQSLQTDELSSVTAVSTRVYEKKERTRA